MTVVIPPVALYVARCALALAGLAVADRTYDGRWDVPLSGYAVAGVALLFAHAPEFRSRLADGRGLVVDLAPLGRDRRILAGPTLFGASLIMGGAIARSLSHDPRPFLGVMVGIALLYLSGLGSRALPFRPHRDVPGNGRVGP